MRHYSSLCLLFLASEYVCARYSLLCHYRRHHHQLFAKRKTNQVISLSHIHEIVSNAVDGVDIALGFVLLCIVSLSPVTMCANEFTLGFTLK